MKIKFTYSLILLSFLFAKSFAQTYQEHLDNCVKNFSHLEQSDSFEAFISARDSCMIGAPLPRIKSKTLSGKQINTDNLKGKIVILNFWSTTCGPCIEEMPGLNKLIDSGEHKDVVFLSFAPEKPEKLIAFLKKNVFRFEVIAESIPIAGDILKLPGMLPYTIIVDTKGKITHMWFGGFGNETYPTFIEFLAQVRNSS
ncbi:MAG: TlpA disulfide reductase family protein [Flavitalea sp.]